MKVIIYALIDPITCKIRYIGRTSKKLNDRLSSHINDAKYYVRKTHKENWIRTLLNQNTRPIIKKLTEVNGWEESYKLEVSLIEKYRDRLTNYYDKGPGCLRQCRQEDRIKISNTLKLKYQQGLIARPKGKTIYVYKLDGTFYKEFPSIQETSRQLNVYYGTIKKHINGNLPDRNLPTKNGKKRVNLCGYQFNTVKVEKMYNYYQQ